MVSSLSCELFTKLLITISEYEKSIEILRRILNEQIDFEPISLFKFIDFENKLYINENDIIKLLNNNSILISPIEAKTLIAFYDSDLDGRISFREFLNMILTEKERDYRETNSFNQKKVNKIGYEIEFSIVSIIEKEISLVKNINNIMKTLTFRSDFNLVDLFALLDSQNLNYLSPNNFKNFLVNNGMNPQDNEIKAIFRKFDIDRDGKVLFWEFKRVISMKSDERNKVTHTQSLKENNDASNDIVNNNISTIHQKSALTDSTKLTNVSQFYKSPQYLMKSAISVKNDTKFLSESYNKSFFSFTSQSGFFKKEFITLEESSFIEFLKDMIDIEEDIDKIRSKLAKREDFTLQDAYSLFEINRKGYITASDLKFALKFFEVFCELDELEFFVRNHAFENNKKKDVLTFHEFSQILIPYNEEDQKLLKTRDPISLSEQKINKYDIFSQETKKIFNELFMKLLNSEITVEQWRKKLNSLQGFNLREMFNKLDRYQKNYIILDDLIYYLKKNNSSFNQFSISLLFIKLDKDKDGRIIYHEFTDEIYPKSNDFLY